MFLPPALRELFSSCGSCYDRGLDASCSLSPPAFPFRAIVSKPVSPRRAPRRSDEQHARTRSRNKSNVLRLTSPPTSRPRQVVGSCEDAGLDVHVGKAQLNGARTGRLRSWSSLRHMRHRPGSCNDMSRNTAASRCRHATSTRCIASGGRRDHFPAAHVFLILRRCVSGCKQHRPDMHVSRSAAHSVGQKGTLQRDMPKEGLHVHRTR